METFVSAVYLLSLLSFAASLGIFLFLYMIRRTTLIRHYLWYLACGFIQAANAYFGQQLYSRLETARAVFLMPWFRYLTLVTTAGLTVAAPAFFLAFAREPFEGRMKRIFTALALAVLLLSPLTFAPVQAGVVPNIPWMLALVAFLWGMFYSQVRIIRAYPHLQERLFRIGIPVIIAYNLVCTIGGTIDSIFSQSQIAAGEYPSGILFTPIVYIFWNAIAFIWTIRFHPLLVETASAPFEPDPVRVSEYGLTARELDLVRSLSTGLSNKEIAAELGISAHTVRNHIHSIFGKTGSRSRVDLVRKLMP